MHPLLQLAQKALEPAYRNALRELPVGVQNVLDYHRGWCDSADTPRQELRGGRFFHPALVFGCAVAAGGDATSAFAVDSALAVEFLHDWTMIRSGVLAGDSARRQGLAASAVFDLNRAVLAGDVLLSLAVTRANRLPFYAARVVSDVFERLCVGQWTDLNLPRSHTPSVEEALATTCGKTSALLAAACLLGARAGGARGEQAYQYAAFGCELGIAFRAVDDLLGLWGDPEVTGKPVGADLTDRKCTLPIVVALASGTAEGEKLATMMRSPVPLEGEELSRALECVEAAGGRAWTEAEVRTRTELALAHLDAAGGTGAGRADLRSLAAMLVDGDR